MGHFLRNEDGSAVVLVLVVGVALGVAVELGVNKAVQSRTATMNARVLDVRRSLALQFGEYANLGVTFRSSLDPNLSGGANQALRDCVVGNGVSPCRAGVEQPLSLY